jgi:polyisoprenoid-binding protein YceI
MRVCLSAILLVVVSSVPAQTYTPIDAESTVYFRIKNFGSTVDGRFTGLKGIIRFDINAISATVFDVTVDAATIDTGIEMRDNHLVKVQYFDVAKFSMIRFISTKVVATSNPNEAVVTGNLSIKNITKEISFPFNFKMKHGTPHFIGEFNINRRDFGVGGSSLTLSDELKVILNVLTEVSHNTHQSYPLN